MPAPDADEALLSRWQAGDAQAGSQLFNRHFDGICRFFANKVGDEIDDLIQKTFLACLENAAGYRGEGSFRGYLFGIARNVLRRHYRDKRYQRSRESELEASVHDLAPGPSMMLGERQEEQLLLQALRHLPLDLQITLELYYWESLSGSEMAAVLEIPEGTVRGRIRRAKELLEAELARISDNPALLESTVGGLESWARRLRDAHPRAEGT